MNADKEIRLRLRFYKDVSENIDVVRQKFEKASLNKFEDFKLKVAENHVWMYIIGNKKEYWSPHLHLQLETKNENETHIRGLFGPDQSLWTLFMFLHFIVIGIFTVFLMFTYSNYILKQSITFDVVVLVLMIIVWFLLYFIARQIRHNGNGQMYELENLFLKILSEDEY